MATLTATVHGRAISSVAEAVEKVVGSKRERFFEGTATGFRLAGGASEYRTDGRWSAESSSQAPFRTRLLVVRPGYPARLNGTCASTTGTTSRPARASSLPGSVRGASSTVRRRRCLRGADRCGRRDGAGGSGSDAGTSRPTTRSGSDRSPIPGTDYSFDIFTQAAQLLGPDRPGEPDPLPGFDVRHVIATGGSQSGARLMTYYDGVQPLASRLRRLPAHGVPERARAPSMRNRRSSRYLG